MNLIKHCKICEQEKPIGEFQKRSASKDGHNIYCKICLAKYNQSRYINNNEKILSKSKEWQKNNKEKVRQTRKNYFKKYPWAKIIKNLKKSLQKRTNYRSELGCDTKELKLYLEKQFSENITWDNYGKVWQVNRIKQAQLFNLDDPMEVNKINHFTNLTIKTI